MVLPALLPRVRPGSGVGSGTGSGLTCYSADARSGCPANDLSAGPRFKAPTGAAGLICLAWVRGRGSQVRAASGCVPSLNPSTLRKG